MVAAVHARATAVAQAGAVIAMFSAACSMTVALITPSTVREDLLPYPQIREGRVESRRVGATCAWWPPMGNRTKESRVPKAPMESMARPGRGVAMGLAASLVDSGFPSPVHLVYWVHTVQAAAVVVLAVA